MRWLRRFLPLLATTAGERGERAAAKHLRSRGYQILARNLRSRVGEIDILAFDPAGRCVVVVEVKTGTDPRAIPELRVDRRKQAKLTSLAAGLARRRGLDRCTIRFDVVGVIWPDGAREPLRLSHHVNAFESRY